MSGSEVFFHINGSLGVITLNRPKALNALSPNMIYTLLYQLREWQYEPSVTAVLIKSTSDKAFCAGGDIKNLHQSMTQEKFKEIEEFYLCEYQLNYLISTYAKPYISFIDGLCMGGGMGISQHGKYRVITKDVVMAMPETTIGYFPDIGSAAFLSKTEGSLGMYYGLTGNHLTADDTMWCDFATHMVKSDDFWPIENELAKVRHIDDAFILSVLSSYTQKISPQSYAQDHFHLIEKHFNHDTLEGIFDSLSKDDSAFAQEILKVLNTKCPLSLKVTFTYLKNAPKMSLRDVFKNDYRLSCRFIHEADFKEGIRALLIDKDKNPQWKYKQISDVPDEKVNTFFKPIRQEWMPNSKLTNLDENLKIEIGVFN